MGFFDIFRTGPQNTVVATETEQARTRDVAFDATAETRTRVSRLAVAANGSGAHMQGAIARNIAIEVQAKKAALEAQAKKTASTVQANTTEEKETVTTTEEKETVTLRGDAQKPLPQMADDFGFITPNEGEREVSPEERAAARATNLKLLENERPLLASPDLAREAAARVAQRLVRPLPPTPTTPPAQLPPAMAVKG